MPAPTLTRDAWLAARAPCIGASDCAAALGCSEYRSPLELAARLAGLKEDAEQAATAPSEAAELGLLFEDDILQVAMRRNGWRLLGKEQAEQALGPLAEPIGWVEGRQLFARSVHNPWMTCTYDAIVQAQNGQTIYLDAKLTGGHNWDNGPIMDALLQVQHGLMVGPGLSEGAIAVCVRGTQIVTHQVAKNPDLQALIDSGLAAYMQAILDKRLPDNHRAGPANSRAKAIALLYPKDTGDLVPLGEQGADIHGRIVALSAKAAEIREELDELHDRLKLTIGKASYGVLPDGSGYSMLTKYAQPYAVKGGWKRKLVFTHKIPTATKT
jgi:predicted phage-related endonuclease